MSPRAGPADAAQQRATTTLVVLAVVFLPWMFSDDLLEAFLGRSAAPLRVLIPVDVAGIATALLLALLLNGRRQVRRALPWWVAGLLLTVGLDATVAYGTYRSPAVSVALSALYSVVVLLLVAALVDANPLLLALPRLRRSRPAEWARLRGGVPLICGTFAAYLAGVYWDHVLNPRAVRTGTVCGGAVDQEYFAQVSQVIPLLLIAVGVEARIFERVTDAAERAATIIAVATLCIAEAVAISTLPTANNRCDSLLPEWHEHVAFVVTVAACAVALCTLAWTLLARREPAHEPTAPSVPQREPPPDPTAGRGTSLLARLVVAALVVRSRHRR